MGTHGYRKYFETTAINSGMSPLYVRMLMGQKSGLESSYFKPTLNEMLEGNDKMIGYASLIDILTINEENRLRQKVKQLSSREEDDIKNLRRDMDTITSIVKSMIEKPEINSRIVESARF